MTDFKGIRGWKVQTLSTDPSASVIDTGTWASSNDMNTARRRVLGSGIQTAAIVAAGYSTAAQALAENYDGSSWTETADLNTGRDSGGMAGIAPYTSTIYFGGGNSPPLTGKTETWNGTSWTEVADMNTARNLAAGFGASQTAAIGTGGETPPVVGSTELWNGSSWTEVNDLNTARAFSAATGPTTAGLNFGGTPDGGPTDVGNTESWDGTNWTEVSDLNTARKGLAGSGLYTDALAFGGGGTAVAVTENYNGSSWTEVSDLNTARGTGPAGVGTSSASLCAGGLTTVNVGTTEEWATTPAPTFSKINLGQVYFNSTANAFKVTRQDAASGVWSSGTNVPVGRYNAASFGSQTSLILMGGEPHPSTENVEYDGTSWTESADFPAGNNGANFSAGSTATAGLLATGYQNTGVAANTYEWNGSAWTDASANVNTARNCANMGGGSSTSTILGGGAPPGASPPVAGTANAETWNGSSWTEVNNLNRSRYNLAGGGDSSTSAFVAGGYSTPPAPNTNIADAEIWDGTSWTEVSNLNTGRSTNTGAGTSTNALVFGGGPTSPGRYAVTELWNGTSWTEVADLASGREYTPTSRTSGSVFGLVAASGFLPPTTTATEEWNAPTANEDITVS